jgi:rhodanese-related sulfurtransferase
VTLRKEGQRVYYRLSGDDVVLLLNSLRDVADRHLAEVAHLVTSYLDTKDTLEPVLAEELLARARAGEVSVLDVRPAEEFAAGHLPGAINIPLSELEARLGELRPDQEIVAYCRGPYCVLSYDAVARLREHGLQARRLKDGYPEWKIAGLPVEA